jgi:hypothetical protein
MAWADTSSGRPLRERPEWRNSAVDLTAPVLTRSHRSTNLSEEQAATKLRLWKRGMRTSHRVVPDAGHHIQIDQSDAVIGAVLEVADAARERWR